MTEPAPMPLIGCRFCAGTSRRIDPSGELTLCPACGLEEDETARTPTQDNMPDSLYRVRITIERRMVTYGNDEAHWKEEADDVAQYVDDMGDALATLNALIKKADERIMNGATMPIHFRATCESCNGDGTYWNSLLDELRPCIDCEGVGSIGPNA